MSIYVIRKTPWFDEVEWRYVYNLIFRDPTPANKRMALHHMQNKWQRKADQPGYIVGTILLLNMEFCEPVNLQDVFSLGLIRFVDICVAGRTKLGEMGAECKRLHFPQWVVEMRNGIAHGKDLPCVDDLKDALSECYEWLQHHWYLESIKKASVPKRDRTSRLLMKVALLTYNENAHREEIKRTLRKLNISYTYKKSFRQIVDGHVANGRLSLSGGKPAYIFADVFEPLERDLRVADDTKLVFAYSNLDYFLTVLDRLECLHEFMANMVLVMRRSNVTLRRFIANWFAHIGEEIKKSLTNFGLLKSNTSLNLKSLDKIFDMALEVPNNEILIFFDQYYRLLKYDESRTNDLLDIVNLKIQGNTNGRSAKKTCNLEEIKAYLAQTDNTYDGEWSGLITNKDTHFLFDDDNESGSVLYVGGNRSDIVENHKNPFYANYV